MLELYKGLSEEEIKTKIAELNTTSLQELIKKGQEKYQELSQEKASIETSIKINQENINNELEKLKQYGINSIEELEKTIIDMRNTLNTELTGLISVLNGVETV